MSWCRRCGQRIHRTLWTWNGWKHTGWGSGWTAEDLDHDASPGGGQ